MQMPRGSRVDYRGVELKVLHADVLDYPSDLLVLKHAQASYGADAKAVRIAGVDVTALPAVGSSLLARSPHLASRDLLFLGVEPIAAFNYRSIRNFSRRALALAEGMLPPVREISMTLHGPGFGLDEIEAFESEIAGVIDALDRGEYPKSLLAVSIVEQSESRCLRLRSALRSLLGADETTMGTSKASEASDRFLPRRIGSVGYDSGARSHAFVAMPFAESFEDVLYYGISPPVRAAGLLCERIDQIHFTGSVIDRMKDRIALATVVVADLSDANPNVYLEVGFAWGVKIPCILICNRKTDLKFDLRGGRCLFYGSIMELEKSLSVELAALLAVKGSTSN